MGAIRNFLQPKKAAQQREARIDAALIRHALATVDWGCGDCGADTKTEYYSVKDEVWARAGMASGGGFLCIGCLEKRLRRRLTRRDFSDAPINDLSYVHLGSFAKSARLRDRLRRG